MSDDKLEKAVFRIFSMTHEGKLDWSPAKPPAFWTLATDSVIPMYFESVYEGRTLALFQERYRISRAAKAFSTFLDGDEGDWGIRTRLVLLGPNSEIMFEFPFTRETHGLLEAVRYKAADVDDFVDRILKTEAAGTQA